MFSDPTVHLVSERALLCSYRALSVHCRVMHVGAASRVCNERAVPCNDRVIAMQLCDSPTTVHCANTVSEL